MIKNSRKGNGIMLVSADKKWDYALGIIKVDGLEPSPEFKNLIAKEKRGEMTTDDMRKVLDKKYKMKKNCPVWRLNIPVYDLRNL